MPGFLSQLQTLIQIKTANRPWHIPFMVALGAGVPALVGALLGRVDLAILAAMGAMVFLYIQPLPLLQRMRRLFWCSLGLVACFALGLGASFSVYTATAALFVAVFGATLITRFYAVAPPGSFFFILVTVIGIIQPSGVVQLPLRAGLVAAGAGFSCFLALLYSLLPRAYPPQEAPAAAIVVRPFALILEAGVIAFFVATSYVIAIALSLDNPYWVPISCAAVMQGASFRMVVQRKLHRVFGTALGLILAALLFKLPLNPVAIALLIMLLTFVVEFLVMRNYGLAVIFITPLTVLFAEATAVNWVPEVLLRARLLDIVLGSLLGLIGGWVVYHPTAFERMERWLMRLCRCSS